MSQLRGKALPRMGMPAACITCIHIEVPLRLVPETKIMMLHLREAMSTTQTRPRVRAVLLEDCGNDPLFDFFEECHEAAA